MSQSLLEQTLRDTGIRAKMAARQLTRASAATKVEVLHNLATLLDERRADILKANAKDRESAVAQNMDSARLDRLTMTPAIIDDMIAACHQVADLPDPVGAMIKQWQQPNGILVGRMRVPLGVIAMIYEARPNVTIDAAILCIKAGNAVILRGGSEAFHSNAALAELLHKALRSARLPQEVAQLLPMTEREAVSILCKLHEYIDVMIPRGGESLVRTVSEAATMPVLKHFMGVCHAYVDDTVDLTAACNIILNAKAQRPGVCNALECLLVHKDVADTFLPMIVRALAPAKVELRACPRSLSLLGEHAVPQQASDLGQEFHALVLAVCVVDTMDDALNHIARYGSNHTEIICSNNYTNTMRFMREVDASMIGVNVSTRFNDGGQLGLGAEIGISTTKLHSYGPMGVEELTTTKFVVLGNGQVRV